MKHRKKNTEKEIITVSVSCGPKFKQFNICIFGVHEKKKRGTEKNLRNNGWNF